MKYFNYNGLRDYRDPEYEEFDFDDYESAMDEEADRDIEERLLAKYE